MRRVLTVSVLLLALILPEWTHAQMLGPRFGLSMGFSRTFWSQAKYDEGYAGAGTAGPALDLRLRLPVGLKKAITPYLHYNWLQSTVSYLSCDTCYGDVINERRFFREIDFGLNFEFALSESGSGFYLALGPLARWGYAGEKAVGQREARRSEQAAWFGIALATGYRVMVEDGGAVAFVEPTLVFSPDAADHAQKTYPPQNLNLKMGVLF